MSILSIELQQPHALSGPACEDCGGLTRLAGIEPHPRLPNTDLRTYECSACETVSTVVAAHPSRGINAIMLVDQKAGASPGLDSSK